MKQQSIYIVLLFVTSLLGGCTDLDKGNPYEDQLHTLQVTAVYPDDYAEYLREGITVQIEDIARGNSYKTVTDQNGTAQFALTNGIYRIQSRPAYIQRTGRQGKTRKRGYHTQRSAHTLQSRCHHYQGNLLRRMYQAAAGRYLSG